MRKKEIFSILIPTWNNLDFLKLCIESIRKNSFFNHQILVYSNESNEEIDNYLESNSIEFIKNSKNVGICIALNSLRTIVKTDYIVYMNDDMYCLPEWDKYLMDEIKKIGHEKFFLSSTTIQPNKFWCKSIKGGYNYGTEVQNFKEEKLLNEYKNISHYDWNGATWPPNVVHKNMWDIVGGYSIEFSPGMYSDPDFSAKLWKSGVRIFKGLDKSRIYHFESKTTKRIKKNDGSSQFLYKWGITSNTFTQKILRRGEKFDGKHDIHISLKEKFRLFIKINIKKLKQVL